MTALPEAPASLSSWSILLCPVCGHLATWRVVGDDCEERVCDRCCGFVAREVQRRSGEFFPLTLLPIFPLTDGRPA